MTEPIEITTKYVTSVDDLPAAWTFVMEHLDKVGPKPSIHITPKSIYAWSDMGNESARPIELFEVVVSGMSETEGQNND